jgi:crotonobetainyl-CoA:carnitine CoA-transferase CaiB-like acyl-CoA transferase
MILADLGADIIKVERIDGGDDARGMPPHRGPWGSYFIPINRGKRSISLDLRNPAARDAVLKLAESCDVCVENFRGGKAAELGLDEPAIRARKPDIIYASLSAYGSRGPDYSKPGYDAILQARSGIMSVTGVNEDSPMRAGVSILDMGAGVWMALGIVTALLERQRSGRGQRLDASLLQTGVMLMCYHLLYRQFTGVNPRPEGARHASVAPYGAFATADGAIMIGISNDRLFRRLCKALDRADWLDEPLFLQRRALPQPRRFGRPDRRSATHPAHRALGRGLQRKRCTQRRRPKRRAGDAGSAARSPRCVRRSRSVRRGAGHSSSLADRAVTYSRVSRWTTAGVGRAQPDDLARGRLLGSRD